VTSLTKPLLNTHRTQDVRDGMLVPEDKVVFPRNVLQPGSSVEISGKIWA